VQQLSIRADVDVARSVENEVGPAEGAIGACRLVPNGLLQIDLVREVPQANPSTSPNELNTTLTPHSIIHGDACFAYFNKIWGIPPALL
jgi:hypothetical protein